VGLLRAVKGFQVAIAGIRTDCAHSTAFTFR
jgi:hypothetical protein